MTVTVAVVAVLSACGGRTGLSTASDSGPRDQRVTSADHKSPPRDHTLPDRARPHDLAPLIPDGPHTPCAPTYASVHKTISSQMVVCRAATKGLYDQCNAHALCGPGWRLCKASEYRKRFGSTAGAPATETSWIGGCVMSNGKPHAPRDEVCSDCTFTVVKAPIIGWHCHKDAASFVQRRFAGLVSHPECWRVGVKSAATAAYWAPNTTDYLLRQAFCCR